MLILYMNINQLINFGLINEGIHAWNQVPVLQRILNPLINHCVILHRKSDACDFVILKIIPKCVFSPACGIANKNGNFKSV